ncbi:MAG: hypothetical protein PVJ52_01810, partial [Candidatus Woesebacteria bacterium]
MPAEKKTEKKKERKKERKEEEKAHPVYVKREPEETLIEWTAPARPFKRRNREFWVTVIAIVAVSGLVLFLIEGVMPVILIISLVFLFYILTTVEPDKIKYAITSRGVKIADKRTNWNLINRFWFGRRFESRLLVFETLSLPGRLELVV